MPGEHKSDMFTVPVKPLRLLRVIADVPVVPGEIVRVSGLDVILKSGAVLGMSIET
jgi:hypothetical protein